MHSHNLLWLWFSQAFIYLCSSLKLLYLYLLLNLQPHNSLVIGRLEEKTVLNDYATTTKTVHNDSNCPQRLIFSTFLVIVDSFSRCGIVIYSSFSSSGQSTLLLKGTSTITIAQVERVRYVSDTKILGSPCFVYINSFCGSLLIVCFSCLFCMEMWKMIKICTSFLDLLWLPL
jgi:hypothetical protein